MTWSLGAIGGYLRWPFSGWQLRGGRYTIELIEVEGTFTLLKWHLTLVLTGGEISPTGKLLRGVLVQAHSLRALSFDTH